MSEALIQEGFSPLAIHPEIQQRLFTQWQQQRLPHAFLFYGPPGVGKEALAIELAKLLNCLSPHAGVCNTCSACRKIQHLEHPDVHLIFPTPAEGNVKPEELQLALQQKAANPFKISLLARVIPLSELIPFGS